MTFTDIILYIVIPGLLGGIFAPMVVNLWKKIFSKWYNKNK